MLKIVAFDMDGTIADTIPMCIEAFRNSISPYTDYELSEEKIIQTFGLNEIGMIKSVVTQDWESAIRDFYAEYERLHDKVTDIFPDMLKFLMFLKKKKIPLALITGKGEKCCAITLKKLGISKIFDEILCGSEIYPNKKENMEYLLKKYAISKSEFCYIGDTIEDIQVCRRIGVPCFSAAWKESADAISLEKENPNCVFKQVRDLYEYLKQNIE